MAETDRTLVTKDDALWGAAVSAAVGVAVYGLRKALAERGGLPLPQGVDRDAGEHRRSSSMAATAWQSASDSLLPLAEDAAGAAGKWAAKKSPALIRDRLLPRFIEAFKAAD